jgi:hypothetical protein
MRLGDNLITNGDFASGETGWTFTGNIDHQVTGGELEVYRNGAAPATFYQDFTRKVLPGCTFLITFGTLRNDSAVTQQFTVHLWNPDESLANLSQTISLSASEDLSGNTYVVSDTTPGIWGTTTRFEVFIETVTDNQPALYFDDIQVQTVYTSSVADVSNIVFSVDFDDDGYSDADAITEVLAANVSVGIQAPGARVAGVGQATVVLDNSSRKFSPLESTGPYFGNTWLARPCQIEVVVDDVAVVILTATTLAWLPESNLYATRNATLLCQDLMADWQRTEEFILPLQEGQDANDLLNLVGSAVFRAAAASGTVTLDSNVEDDDILIIGDDTYTFKETLASAYDVLIGATSTDTALNLERAINGDARGIGSSYFTGTLYNQQVTGSASSNVITVTARARGVYGNSIGMSTQAPHKDANRYTLNTGTLGSGVLTDTYTQNGVYMQFDEVTGTPGFDIEYEFDIVGTGEDLNLYGRYQGSGSHTVNVDAWNGGSWDNLGTLASSGSDAMHTYTLTSSHTVASTVIIRFIHTSSGNPTHDLYIDHLNVEADQNQAVDVITLSGSTLSGGAHGPTTRRYNIGSQDFDYAADTWGAGQVNGISVIDDIVTSEWGWFLIARDGVPEFRNRSYVFLAQTASPTSLDNTQSVYLNPRMSLDDLTNRTIVNYTPRRGVSSGTIASSPAAILVPGSTGAERWNGIDPAGDPGTVAIRIPFKDQVSGRNIGATRVNPIIAGTHYTVNEAADGNGPDYTADGSLTLSWIIAANSIEITFTNTALGPLFVLDLFVEGVGLVAFDSQQFINEDTTSIATYDVRQAPPVDLPLPMSAVFPESLAQYLTDANKGEQFRIDGLTSNNPGEAATKHLLQIELLDRVELSDDQTGLSEEVYMVIGAVYDLQPGETSNVTFILEINSNFEYWLLDVSRLDQNTRLAL